MAYKIIWLKRASSRLEKIIQYLEQEWSEKVVKEFLRRLINKILIISENPQIGKVSKKKVEVRRFVITKQVSLYYRVKNNRIIILTLFDNRQNPSKLKI